MADNALLAIIEVQEASRRKPMSEVLFRIALQRVHATTICYL